MKLGKSVFAVFAFFIVFAGLEIYAQDSKLPKQIRILNNYASAIPFEDGKTIIAEVNFTGLTVLSGSEISKAFAENRMAIKAGDEFYGYRVAKAVKVIRESLASNGFDKAEIVAFGQKLPKNEMKLNFVIKEGALARVSEVRFEGNVNVSNEELVEDFKQCSDDSWKIYDLRRYVFYARTCTQRFLLSKGFLSVKIREPTLLNVEGNYIVEINLEEGHRYRIGEIKVEGIKAFTEKEVLEMLGLKEGDVLDGKELQNSIYEKLKRIYADKGYVLYNAEFDPKFIEPIAEGLDATVDLLITIDEGELFKLAKIEFTGVEKEQIEELRKLISLEDGEIYSQSKIEEGIKKINETKKFYSMEYDSSDVEVRTTMETKREETERVEGSLLLRRKDVDEDLTKSQDAGELYLNIKLRKIEK
ncbi:MAG: POTRA domain-containing protein [Actinomycetota bacterium]